MKKRVGTEKVIVALDIGTTKICVLVAQVVDKDNLNVIAIGHAPSLGIARGVVVDIGQAVHSIKMAIKEAELMAECKIESVNVGISGSHIQSLNSHGMIPIKKQCVRSSDVASVLSAARAVMVPEGQQILHILPQYFVVDDHQKVLDPIGLFGVRLEVKTHIITGAISSVQNIIRCCQLAGVSVDDIILEPLASAESVLSEDERYLGAAILDIGGGTADFAIYQQGTIRHTKVFATAGNHITNDIAFCVRTTIKDAERVKTDFGRAFSDAESKGQLCSVRSVCGTEVKNIKVDTLVAIIEPRVSELFLMVKQEIEKNNLHHLMPTGIVLTGGGALLKNIDLSAQMILDLPVRVGNPSVPELFKESLSSPSYATTYGLLLYVLKKSKNNLQDRSTGPMITRVLWRMKSWVADFF